MLTKHSLHLDNQGLKKEVEKMIYTKMPEQLQEIIDAFLDNDKEVKVVEEKEVEEEKA